ncbi:NADH-quinone oxidoreductase subunit J [Lignipirellula cremea]|uniref:NADH-quinone oxidoreductase subunit J n=1 Tax=Lignipirellula cremea TaxID=2528010 RepID=A0A518DQU8_9BACT|nr:NADH-quinone oxidoreductase subunit J [Lignipirellula cremea]QDU94213.1 NADH-quinone oxidoreductase subunit J [Lignipirellula cremea]
MNLLLFAPMILAQTDAAPIAAESAAPSPATMSLLVEALASPLLWSMVLGAVGLWLLLPGQAARSRGAAYFLALIQVATLLAVIWPAFEKAFSAFTPGLGILLGCSALSLVLLGAWLATDRGGLGAFWFLAVLATAITASVLNTALWTPLLVLVLISAAMLVLLSPLATKSPRCGGAMLSIGAVVLLGCMVAPTTEVDQAGWLFFWLLAGLTVFSAVAAVSMQSPVYSAIWFGVSLLATAGLFLIQGAQFLSVATVAVYAGAILVTFLFVLMLAQPEGHSYYDRTSWGAFPTIAAVMAAALIVGGLTYRYTKLDSGPIGPSPRPAAATFEDGIGHPEHMAKLGGYMFSRHMLSVEAAGSLLLAALVGAVAILIKGREEQEAAASRRSDRAEGGAA